MRNRAEPASARRRGRPTTTGRGARRRDAPPYPDRGCSGTPRTQGFPLPRKNLKTPYRYG